MHACIEVTHSVYFFNCAWVTRSQDPGWLVGLLCYRRLNGSYLTRMPVIKITKIYWCHHIAQLVQQIAGFTEGRTASIRRFGPHREQWDSWHIPKLFLVHTFPSIQIYCLKVCDSFALNLQKIRKRTGWILSGYVTCTSTTVCVRMDIVALP